MFLNSLAKKFIESFFCGLLGCVVFVYKINEEFCAKGVYINFGQKSENTPNLPSFSMHCEFWVLNVDPYLLFA